MLDSEFWRESAEKFRALDPSGQYLWGTWIARVKSDGTLQPAKWSLSGVGDIGHRVEVAFDPMARRAGQKLKRPGDLLDVWLNAVNDRTDSHQSSSGGYKEPSGNIVETIGGNLLSLCVYSSELCSELESEALESEHNFGVQNQPVNSSYNSATSELHDMGLRIEMSEAVAENILGELDIITGRQLQGEYDSASQYKPLWDAYRAIALAVVSPVTTDNVIEEMIPKTVDAYRIIKGWLRNIRTEECRPILNGAITEWKGRRRKMQAVHAAEQETTRQQFASFVVPDESNDLPELVSDSYPRSDSPSPTTNRPAVRRRANTKTSRKTARSPLLESYISQFPEKITLLDICWAAKQYYREWKRWKSGEAKDGSTPDRAFRAILASTQRPSEYRTEPRPLKWQ